MDRTCTLCGGIKPLTDFSPRGDGKGKNPYKTRCKSCVAQLHRKYMSSPKRKHEASLYAWERRRSNEGFGQMLMANYGLTTTQYNQMAARQDFRCAVCGGDDSPLVVDHCHKMSRVRGLLCQSCNKGIGHFFDSPKSLQAASRYVQNGSIVIG